MTSTSTARDSSIDKHFCQHGTTKRASTANWYLACFDQATGEFLTGAMVSAAHHGTQECVYSVMPDYIQLFN